MAWRDADGGIDEMGPAGADSNPTFVAGSPGSLRPRRPFRL